MDLHYKRNLLIYIYQPLHTHPTKHNLVHISHFTMTTICDEHFISQKKLHTRLRQLLKNKTDILIPKNQTFAIKTVLRYNKVYESNNTSV